MPDLPSTVRDALYQAAKGPKSVRKPDVSAESHDLDALMRVADREAAEAAAARPGWGLRFAKIIPGEGG